MRLSPSVKAVKAKVAASAAVASSPPSVLNITMITLAKNAPIHRIHLDLYTGNQFNLGLKGNAQFSPIKNVKGAPIPTLYGGSTFDCAAMESVFYDVRFVPSVKTSSTNSTGRSIRY